jgi:hypothetical protein
MDESPKSSFESNEKSNSNQDEEDKQHNEFLDMDEYLENIVMVCIKIHPFICMRQNSLL